MSEHTADPAQRGGADDCCRYCGNASHQARSPDGCPYLSRAEVEDWRAIDARLAALHGYAPVEELEVSALVESVRRERDRQTVEAVQRVEAKLDRLITALQAGAIGAWRNHGRD